MKKIISIALLLAMCLALFAGCKKDATTTPSSNLPNAKAYLVNMYQTGSKGEAMVLTADKDLLSAVTIDGVEYSVEWAVSVTQGPSDSAKIGESSKANHVLLDINESPAEDILFTATATVKDADGNSESASFSYKVAASATAGMSDEEIVEEAYKLENGEMMEGNATLTGVITMVKTPYDPSYKNITVIIQIGDLADKKIECYRLKGDGADALAIGDTITVTGILKNYNGTIEFDAGCTLDKVVPGERVEAPTDPKEIVAAAYALAAGDTLKYEATLTGTITEIKTPYDEGYQNISVIYTIEGCEDKPILCYRLKGEGAANLKVGDVITVRGYITNYNGTIEFTAGCQLTDGQPSGGEDEIPLEKPDTEEGIVKQAFSLAEGKALPYVATLTGKVTKIDTAYDPEYKNVCPVISVAGKEILCYRLKGAEADKVAVGDTLTVSGTIKNHYGTIEFDVGCTLDKRVSGGGTAIKVETDPAKIVSAAFKLKEGEKLAYDATLTGKVTKVDTAYDAQYKNVSVVISVSGKEILCYRLKGDGADKVAVGDTLTVTGRLKNHYGTVEFDSGCKLDKRVSGGGTAIKVETDPKKIVAAAFALKENTQLAYDATLTGKVTKIDTAYDAQYKNVSVVFTVEGKSILCYRLKGDGADKVAVGDTITVTGRLKNHYGTVEFDSGCKLDKRVSGGGTAIKVETDPKKIVAAAFALKENTELAYDATLSGKVTKIDTAYDAQYKNVSVVFTVEGKDILCYRMKGDDAAKVAVGDTITVTGRLKNHYGTVEFDSGCKLDKRVSGGGTAVKPETDPLKIVDAAYALEKGAELAYDATLTGKVTKIKTAYDASYKNVTVIIAVTGRESKPIECFRMKGDDAAKVVVGDTITVTGRLKNYNGTIEFDAGCKLDKRVSGGVVVPTDPKKIVDAAFALDKGASLPYTATLTGKITEINTAYSADYKNITVTIEVEGTSGKKLIECYRMKGEGAENLKVGDTISVTGVLTRYYKEATAEKPELDKIEFNTGCTFKK